MNNQLSDDEVDRIAKSLLQNFAMDDSRIEEIANSPKLLWSLKARIATEKSKQKTSRFFGLRWQLAAFATLILVCGIIYGKLSLSSELDNTVANINLDQNIEPVPSEAISNTVSEEEIQQSNDPSAKMSSSDKRLSLTGQKELKNNQPKHEAVSLKIPSKIKKKVAKTESKKFSFENENLETKTEFIALSYSPASESGQIVRVKVPRSMMVSLGVSNNVSKNSELVNAEVIIDDDGSTRAIRFISDKN